VLVPGVGVPGRAEIGMTIDEFKRYNRDIEIMWSAETELWKEQGWTGTEYSARIPSLRTHFWAPDNKYGVGSLYFDVVPCGTNLVFSGEMEGIHFSPEHNVTRDQIVSAFGVPVHQIANLPDGRPPKGLMTNLTAHIQAGEIVSWNTQRGTETLYYPSGVTFNLKSNRVIRIVITPRKDVEQDRSTVPTGARRRAPVIP
jgi:hypothetical protein